MNIAICDDEAYVRAYIRKLIGQQGVDCNIREFSSGQALLDAQGLCGNCGSQLGRGQEGSKTGESLPREGNQRGGTEEGQSGNGTQGSRAQSLPPGEGNIDILFLDISMDGLDGMDVARRLRSRAEGSGGTVLGRLPLLIFVTGYPEYAIEAFSVHAFQFLVKPIKEQEFSKVFGQAVQEYRCLAGKGQAAPKELLVRMGHTTRKVLAGDIYYAESSNRKVILCLGDEKIAFYGRISQLEEELVEHFFRVHKGYLVNMEYVERYSRTEVWMKNGDRLLVSKYKYQDFVKAYLKFISEESH